MSVETFKRINQLRREYARYNPTLKIGRKGYYLAFKKPLPNGYLWMYV